MRTREDNYQARKIIRTSAWIFSFISSAQIYVNSRGNYVKSVYYCIPPLSSSTFQCKMKITSPFFKEDVAKKFNLFGDGVGNETEIKK